MQKMYLFSTIMVLVPLLLLFFSAQNFLQHNYLKNVELAAAVDVGFADDPSTDDPDINLCCHVPTPF
jgi:hypothetical protein